MMPLQNFDLKNLNSKSVSANIKLLRKNEESTIIKELLNANKMYEDYRQCISSYLDHKDTMYEDGFFITKHIFSYHKLKEVKKDATNKHLSCGVILIVHRSRIQCFAINRGILNKYKYS